MNDEGSSERTQTDERVAENQTPAPIASLTRDAGDVEPATGLPRGQHDRRCQPARSGRPARPVRRQTPGVPPGTIPR
jgi:hypothetical protein